MKRPKTLLPILFVIVFASGCVYYNTFYYARKSFNDAESKRKSAGPRASGKSFSGQYNKAIDKSQKILEKYPNSSWYDDALFVNGVSNYYIEEYSKAERRFRELIADYPKSPFVKESRLYLAKTKLKLGEEAEAMVQFEALFTESKERSVKVEAALALGQYYFDKKSYPEAEKYFSALVDSLGNEQEKVVAQMYIADGQYARFNYKSALDSYLKVLDHKPTSADQYKANFRAGECSFFLHQIEDGMAYFNKLAAEPLYFDSLPSIKLMIAFGYELDGNVQMAEEIYNQITVESQRQQGAVAYYNLGLIHQFDYENYVKAKEYYDKAKSFGSNSGIYQDALQRSSDIGKLQEYSKMQALDTTATQDDIDNAAKTQYLLAELYLTQLGKADSAIQEFQYVIDKFPNSYLAPKALIAKGLVLRDSFDDTLGFDSSLRRVLQEYPHSDFTPEAIGLLGLAGTIADTGYAELYFHKAEQFAFNKNSTDSVTSKNLDSAKYYYRLVADSFPRSSLNNQARFALLWLVENYESPGDSSLYFAYVNFADSFATTEFGKEAQKKIVVKPKNFRQMQDTSAARATPSQEQTPVVDSSADSTAQRTLSQEEKYYIDDDGNKITDIEQAPIRTDKEFRYPTAAYTLNFEGKLVFQIKLDPFGDVTDLVLKNPTPSEELNTEAKETVKGFHFDMQRIRPEQYDSWMVFYFIVELPQSLR